MTGIRTKYTRTNKIEVRIVRIVSGKWMILLKRRPRIFFVRPTQFFWHYDKTWLCFRRWRQLLNFTRYIRLNILYQWLKKSDETVTKTSWGSEIVYNNKEQHGTIFDNWRPWIRCWEKVIAVIDHTVLRIMYISTWYKTEFALHTQTPGFSLFHTQTI